MSFSQDFMKTKPVLPLLASMAIPMMLSMLIQSLYNIIDSIFVARLGTAALTAVSLVYPLQNIVVSVSVGIGVGISSAIAVNLGRKDRLQASRAASVGMMLTVFHCAAFILFGLLATRPFLRLFTGDPQTFALACQYAYIVLCFSSGSLLQISLEKIFQATGAMITTMYALAAGCIVNIILDPVLIFGLAGFPKLGVAGAAIATVIGQTSSLVIYLIICAKKDIGVSIGRRYLSFDRTMIRQIYSVGIPSAVMIGLPSILVSILNSMLIRFSEVYVAVLGIYLKLQTFIYMPASGIIQGMRPIIGYNYGAGEKVRLQHTIRWSMVLTAAVMAVGTAAALLFPEAILALFTDDEFLRQSGVTALKTISPGFVLSTASIVCCGIFEALGKGRESLIISLLRQLLIIVVLGELLSGMLGVWGIWISFPIAEAAASIAALILYQKTVRHILKT